MAVQNIGIDDILERNIIDIECVDYRRYIVNEIFKVLDINDIASNIVFVSRCIMNSEDFPMLAEPKYMNELSIIKAFNKLREKELIYAYNIKGDCYNLKIKSDFLKSY